MNARQALGRGGFAAAACVACCAPPIIAALGVTAGLAATVGILLGLAAARTRLVTSQSRAVDTPRVPVASPTRPGPS